MAKPSKILQIMLEGRSAVTFRDFERVLVAFGFRHDRTKGSHRIYVHPAVPRPFPVQPDGKHAKRYQVREFLDIIEGHGLSIDE